MNVDSRAAERLPKQVATRALYVNRGRAGGRRVACA